VGRDDTPSTKPLLDKLGVKPGHRVSVLGPFPEEFVTELLGRTHEVSTRRRARNDLLFLLLTDRADLPRLKPQKDFLVPDGAVWAVWPKGTKAINENDVRDAALDSGLVDVKVVSFSETLSALKLVIRVKDRKR
jgi:hypothetical protein